MLLGDNQPVKAGDLLAWIDNVTASEAAAGDLDARIAHSIGRWNRNRPTSPPPK
jgi:hypothetical protein